MQAYNADGIFTNSSSRCYNNEYYKTLTTAEKMNLTLSPHPAWDCWEAQGYRKQKKDCLRLQTNVVPLHSLKTLNPKPSNLDPRPEPVTQMGVSCKVFVFLFRGPRRVISQPFKTHYTSEFRLSKNCALLGKCL